MVRRGKKKRVTRSRTFRVVDGLIAYGQLSILTEGALGAGPIGVLMDRDKIPKYSTTDRNFLRAGRPMPDGGIMGVAKGAQVVGLADMLERPEDSLAVIIGNVKKNAPDIFIKSFMLQAGGKVFKKLFRSNLATANRVIMKPLFGKAVAL